MSELSDLGLENKSIIAQKLALFENPEYVTLYRFENPQTPYDDRREGIVSRKKYIGSWFTTSLRDLFFYTIQRIQGQKGGKFVIIRIKKSDLDKFDAARNPETENMDIETNNYIIPPEVARESSVEIPCVFRDSWEGKKNLPFNDWHIIERFIETELNDQAIISKLKKML